MDSIDTDVIEGAMKQLSGSSPTYRQHNIKTIRNNVVGLYSHQHDSIFQNKGFWGIAVIILFVLIYSLF